MNGSTLSQLGPRRSLALPEATIPYYVSGEGEPIVFIHGMYAHATWWRNIAPRFLDSHQVIVPEFPFGSHAVPASPDADLTPPGLARMVADFIAALDLERVTIVAGDLAGALTQIVIANYPQHIERVVLLSCDSFDNFPPKLLNYQCHMARLPGARAMTGLSARLMRWRWVRRLPITFRYATKSELDERLVVDWLTPLATNKDTQRDAVKILRGVDNRHTLEAASRFGAFDRPVLLIWGREDKLFPFRYAERLAQAFPNARLVALSDAYTYIAEDQPDLVADAIAEFLDSNSAPAS